MRTCFYNENMYDTESGPDGRMDIAYHPCTPCADTPELADKGGRLMLYHNFNGYPRIFWAEAGTMQSGWVIGIAI